MILKWVRETDWDLIESLFRNPSPNSAFQVIWHKIYACFCDLSWLLFLLSKSGLRLCVMFPLERLDEVLSSFFAFVILRSNRFVGPFIDQFLWTISSHSFSLGIKNLCNFSKSSLYLCFAQIVDFQNSINSPVVLRGCQCSPNRKDLLNRSLEMRPILPQFSEIADFR